MKKYHFLKLSLLLCFVLFSSCETSDKPKKFSVIAFYTGENDLAHISFVNEAHNWFSDISTKYNFVYDSTNDWSNLNSEFLAKYDIVLFLDTRPEEEKQRIAFEQYMKNGGAWIGFHFAGFALKNSAYDMDWKWYHDEFLGSGEYKGNTWRPTSATIRIENRKTSLTNGLPSTFTSSPNEWYSWQNDLSKNPNIQILATIDTSSFPLGTGPKEWEIWHEGYYPVVWTNKNYRMVYINMGHNDMDYEGGTNAPLSSSFSSEIQNTMLINFLLWLGD